ncbi:hypothetical protein MASR1M65_32310 [Saprospiraceae bacterium]
MPTFIYFYDNLDETDMTDITPKRLSERISLLLKEARKQVVQSINHTMVLTYFEVGRMIIEEEQ